ncbi:hypothetical protein [Massilibacteroides sp.]|uniref:hypothetical protein n=1 Tax=Massilibacteroides sp. TaxID=2034766 RepID=UPI002605FC17|nr:hypothetical protein [Massilibacteroides sp.]MDD4515209.1 hypothetical protein [Massilibacteroides sp.]
MGLFSKIFKKRTEDTEQPSSNHTEEFMTLIRVYYQAVIATQLGITNLNMLPDMALFKRMLKIPTQGGKLGVAEKARARKVLMQDYDLSEDFFKEIDRSIKKNCKTQNDVNGYFYKFQGFNTELFAVMEKMMNIRFRLSMLFNGMLRKSVNKAIHKILTQSEWSDISIQKAAWSVRKYQESLGYSEQWISDFVYQVFVLAKKDNTKKKKA